MTTTQQRLLEAEQALAAAEAKVRKLQEQLARESTVSPARLFYPKKGEVVYWLSATPFTANDAFWADGGDGARCDWRQPAFRTYEHAEAMAHSLNVSFLLRVQPGVVEARNEEYQYHIVAKAEGGLTVEGWRKATYKYSEFSPRFDSEQSARAAIKAVGEQEILKAMKAWQGVY